MIETKNGAFNNSQLANRYNITDFPQYNQDRSVSYFPAITDEDLNKFKNHPNVKKITPLKDEKGRRDKNIFPQSPEYNWNNDFFGPIYIPEAGKTIDLNLNILPIYKRLLTVYEGNTLNVQGNQILINGKVATTYTLKKITIG